MVLGRGLWCWVERVLGPRVWLSLGYVTLDELTRSYGCNCDASWQIIDMLDHELWSLLLGPRGMMETAQL